MPFTQVTYPMGQSYLSTADLLFLSMPQAGTQAVLTGGLLAAGPYNLVGKTLVFVTAEDGLEDAQVTVTFNASYPDIASVVAAFNILASTYKVVASEFAGRLQFKTIKKGAGQSICLVETGTANVQLGYSNVVPVFDCGTSTVTNDFTDEELQYACVSASSIADGYLARRYQMPVTSFESDVKENVGNIATDILMFRNGYKVDGTYDKNFKEKKDKSIDWFSNVGNRMIHPAIVASHKPVPNANNGTAVPRDIRGWYAAMGLSDNGRCC